MPSASIRTAGLLLLLQAATVFLLASFVLITRVQAQGIDHSSSSTGAATTGGSIVDSAFFSAFFSPPPPGHVRVVLLFQTAALPSAVLGVDPKSDPPTNDNFLGALTNELVSAFQRIQEDLDLADSSRPLTSAAIMTLQPFYGPSREEVGLPEDQTAAYFELVSLDNLDFDSQVAYVHLRNEHLDQSSWMRSESLYPLLSAIDGIGQMCNQTGDLNWHTVCGSDPTPPVQSASFNNCLYAGALTLLAEFLLLGVVGYHKQRLLQPDPQKQKELVEWHAKKAKLAEQQRLAREGLLIPSTTELGGGGTSRVSQSNAMAGQQDGWMVGGARFMDPGVDLRIQGDRSGMEDELNHDDQDAESSDSRSHHQKPSGGSFLTVTNPNGGYAVPLGSPTSGMLYPPSPSVPPHLASPRSPGNFHGVMMNSTAAAAGGAAGGAHVGSGVFGGAQQHHRAPTLTVPVYSPHSGAANSQLSPVHEQRSSPRRIVREEEYDLNQVTPIQQPQFSPSPAAAAANRVATFQRTPTSQLRNPQPQNSGVISAAARPTPVQTQPQRFFPKSPAAAAAHPPGMLISPAAQFAANPSAVASPQPQPPKHAVAVVRPPTMQQRSPPPPAAAQHVIYAPQQPQQQRSPQPPMQVASPQYQPPQQRQPPSQQQQQQYPPARVLAPHTTPASVQQMPPQRPAAVPQQQPHSGAVTSAARPVGVPAQPIVRGGPVRPVQVVHSPPAPAAMVAGGLLVQTPVRPSPTTTGAAPPVHAAAPPHRVIAPPIDLGNSSPAVDDLEAEELPELVSPSSQGSTPLSPNDASPPPPRAVNAHQMAASRSVVQRQQDDDDEEEEEEESGSEEEEEGSD